MKCSRDAAISRIPAPHLLKQGQLQLADASFRDIYDLECDLFRASICLRQVTLPLSAPLPVPPAGHFLLDLKNRLCCP